MQRKIFWWSLFCTGVERRKVEVVQFTIYPNISWHFKFHSSFFRYKLSHWWDSIMMLLCNYACFRLLQELGNTVWEDWRTVENIYAFLKSWGWGHISVGRVLYMKAQGRGFGPWQPCKKPGMAMLVCNANTKKAETGESWGSFASQPCLVSKL